MKVLKIETTVSVEIIMPLPDDIPQDEIDELHSEKGQQAFYESALENSKQQAKEVGGVLKDMKVIARVVEV